jgi:hypothetical protein
MNTTPNFQHQTFSNGEFCIHRIIDPNGSHKGRLSAWFDKDGNPTDAEQFIPNARAGLKTRPVRRNGKIWAYLIQLGKRYVNP